MRNEQVNAFCPKCGVTVMADIIRTTGRKRDETCTVCPECRTVIHQLIETVSKSGQRRYEVKA